MSYSSISDSRALRIAVVAAAAAGVIADGGCGAEPGTPRERASSIGSVNAARPEVDLVRIHAHRDVNTPTPPSAPLPADPSSSQHATSMDQALNQFRLSEKRAAIAAKRVPEYREIQARSKTQQAAATSAVNKKREQLRVSNRKIYEQMGVSTLNGNQRYLVLVEEKKLLKQHQKAREKLEKRQRWYNERAEERDCSHECLAPDPIAKLQARSNETCKQRYRDTVQRDLIIKAHQTELRKQASAVVAKCTHTEYVRGSYLLKKTPKEQSEHKTKPRRESLTNLNDTTQLPEAEAAGAPVPIETPQAIERL